MVVRIKYNMDHNITQFSCGLILSGTRNLSIFLGFIATSFSNVNIEGLMETGVNNNIIAINYK
jgi:hypothetical protein